MTGLPRFDTLERNSETAEENSIYIMPTWRQWIAPSYDLRAENFEDITKSKDNFKDSDYFKFYNGLLSDSRLHGLIEKYDYNIYFALHPRMGAEMNSFYSDDRIHLLMPESFVYSEAFKKMKMLVTDYSSIAFNIGILKKPVIYAQFDYDEFYNSGKHTSKAGYFSFENDGFGPVVYSKDAVIEEIAEKLHNGMEIEEKYEQRIENFFFYPPKGKTRSELIVEHILELDKNK